MKRAASNRHVAVWRAGTWGTTSSGGLSAMLNGRPVEVEAPGYRLTAMPEALAGMFFLPAMAAGVRLELGVPLQSDWLEQMESARAVMAGWWGYDGMPLINAKHAPAEAGTVADGVAQCFTSGLDSLYTALFESPRTSHFMFMPEYEPGGLEPRRLIELADLTKRAASEFGVKPVIMHSNLRYHPDYDGVAWERGHGMALAFTAMLLREEFGTLVIPSSFARASLQPWGSHPDLDHHWTLPGRFTVRHADCELARVGKLRRIVSEQPWALASLRVCARGPAGRINCSSCRKCVRTMVLLVLLGAERYARSFDWGTPLEERLDRLPRTPDWGLDNWLDTARRLEDGGHPTLAHAVRRLVRRSRWGNRLAAPEKAFRAWRKRLLD